MPAHAVPIDIKEQGVTWLLPPYSWSIRHIARKLDLSPSVIARWRLELVQQGLLPENEKISSVDGNECKRKLTAVCSHQTRIGNLDAHLTQTDI